MRVIGAFYPGMPGLIEASYTLGHGVTPGIVTLKVFPQLAQLAGTGDVVLTDGVTTVRVPDCRVVDVKVDAELGGFTATVFLEDHRWRWRYGAYSVDGHYNIPAVRVADVPKVPDWGQQLGNPAQSQFDVFPDQYKPQIQGYTRKTARELGEILCRAMGESSFSVLALPTDQYPEVHWEGANAAQELQLLAEQFGCRVVYNPFGGGGVTLARLGVGAQLPAPAPDELARDGVGFDPPEPPSKIVFYGAPKVWQQRFRLRPVGLDFDGRVKAIDKLSYAPAMKWKYYAPPFAALQSIDVYLNATLPGNRTAYDAHALANATVWRWYQIANTLPKSGDDTFWVPANTSRQEDRHRREDVFLTGYLAEAQSDDLGQRSLFPAKVYGRAYRGSISYLTTEKGEQVRIPFAVDAERQLVMFAAPVYYVGHEENDTTKPILVDPELVLECAVMVRDPVTHQLVRPRYEFTVPGGTTGELAVVKEEIREYWVAEYGNFDSHTVRKATTNADECRHKAKYFFDAEVARFQLLTPQDRTYNGIKGLACDGAVQQVTWSMSPSGALTRASRNTEHSVVIDPYAQRRLREEVNLKSIDQRVQQAKVIRRIRDNLRGGNNPFQPPFET
jgi:hypothetical protein